MRLLGAQPVRISNAVTGGTGLMVAGRGVFLGGSLIDAAGAARAGFRLWDSTSAAGVVVGSWQVVAGGGMPITVPTAGVHYEVGLFVESITGTWEGSLWFVPEELIGDLLILQQSYADRVLKKHHDQTDYVPIPGELSAQTQSRWY
jgi:hypothetical protein